jgi:7-cyano-7-deazaguanine synthase in queuosine biosynthesis
MDKASSDSPIKLLWSGGWDSTFRLLNIVLVGKKPVQPYYFIAPHQRKSIKNERSAQAKIRKALFAKYPWTQDLIRPAIIIHVNDIPPDEAITQAHKAAHESQTIGVQYEFMARYCKQQNLQDLEICLHKVGDPNVPPRFIQFLERVGDTQMFTYNLALKDKPEYAFLRYFSYPLMEVDKEDMRQIAKEQGWLPILKKTWFCYTPIFGKIPCGVCSPCLFTIGEGQGWRLPFITRHLHKIWDKAPVRFARKTIRKLRGRPPVKKNPYPPNVDQ